MRFKKVNNFILMRVGDTKNKLSINKDVIAEAVKRKVFDNAPIVYNCNLEFKDYRDNDKVKEYFKDKVIGVILPDTVKFNGVVVTADVMLLEDFASRTHYDNWCIQNVKNSYFYQYNQCELSDKYDSREQLEICPECGEHMNFYIEGNFGGSFGVFSCSKCGYKNKSRNNIYFANDDDWGNYHMAHRNIMF